MGVLNMRVGGVWVPVTASGSVPGPPAGSRYMLDPAEAGPRSDAANIARFGCVGVDGKVGLFAEPDGTQVIINANGKKLSLYQLGAVGGFENFGHLGIGRSTLSNWGFGLHPVHTTINGFWIDGYLDAGDYVLLSTVGTTMVNGRNDVSIRCSNTDIINIAGGTISPYRRIYSRFYIGASSWDTSHISVLNIPSDGTNGARISLHSESYGCHQLRTSIHESGIASLDWSGTAYQPFVANTFTVGSSIKTKTAVRDARARSGWSASASSCARTRGPTRCPTTSTSWRCARSLSARRLPPRIR